MFSETTMVWSELYFGLWKKRFFAYHFWCFDIGILVSIEWIDILIVLWIVKLEHATIIPFDATTSLKFYFSITIDFYCLISDVLRNRNHAFACHWYIKINTKCEWNQDTVIWAKSYFYDLFTIASEYISLAPSTMLDIEFVSHSFFVLEKTKNVKNNLCK